MSFLTKTYLVCNASMMSRIKAIPGFKVNLGQSLLNRQNKYSPADIAIQTHTQFFKEIIHLNGYLGSLHVYTSLRYLNDAISIFNGQDRIDLEIDSEEDVYSAINRGLKEMGKRTGYITDTKAPEEPKIETDTEYKRPAKKLEEMTLDERIQFARNRK